MKKISLAFSSCPNDTFIFKGIVRKLIPLRGVDFDIVIEDVETLNQKAGGSTYDVTKLSIAALGSLTDRYRLLRTGAALGKGCGPLLISLPRKDALLDKTPVVAVPGLGTTACHLFSFYMKDLFADITPEIRPMPFEKVMPSVTAGHADLGVIIHEGRFVYENFGLQLVADLGQWWESSTGLPIPLGCIAVKKEVTAETALTIQELIKESIEHAFLYPEAGYDFIQSHAQELDETVIQKHIQLYVNDFSRDIGKLGETAIQTFFQKSVEAGLLPCMPPLEIMA